MTAVVFRTASKTAPRIPAGLLASLDVVLLERITPETFELVGEAPRWLGQLWPEATVERRDLRPQGRFLFLEHFLPEAASAWAGGEAVTSEIWTEPDATGREWLLEAAALRLDGRPMLVIKFPTVAPEQLREVLQESRELSLEHYRLLKEVDRREVRMHCLVHDLSTPMAALRGSLQMIVEDDLVEPEGAALVALCLRQVEKMRAMTRDLLADAAPEAAEPLTPGTAPDLAAAIDELTTGLAPTATLKNVRFCVEAAPEAFPVLAEPTRLERVLFNLFENALRYAPPGTDVLVRLDDEGETVRASIEDAGAGVPAAEVPRLFRKYAQGGSARGQVGLGLYFCRITVEGWGGAIGYEPAPGGGARFWFRLPKPSGLDGARG